MSPRAAGEADKFGNRYEGRWTAAYLLYILAGVGRSIVVEKAGELDDGAEFLYTRENDGVVEAHQLKRQNGTAGNWTVKSLQRQDIWTNARRHLDAGREFHFVSTTPAPKLNELADRARRSASVDEFIKEWLTTELRSVFDDVAAADICGTSASAWRMLRGMWFRCQDERAVVGMNAAMAGLLLDGAAGQLAAAGLGDLAMDLLGVELTSSLIESRLSDYGLALGTIRRRENLGRTVDTVTQMWRAAVEREMLSPAIPRAEAATLADLIADPSSPVTFLVGSAGGGKTTVLSQVIDQLVAADMAVLAFRLDRVEDFATAEGLGAKLGLEVSPVSALAAAAGGKRCVLVIDQLDVVSLASGRMSTSFDVVEELTREAAAFPSMRIVLACRKFDLDNDHRIRNLQAACKAESLVVSPLSGEAVDTAVDAMGLNHEKLRAKQRDLLRLPLHLVLLAEVADQPHALDFQTTAHLFDAYWDRKRRAVTHRKPGVRFAEVVAAVADAISDRAHLSVPDSILDPGELADHADAVISEHVLVRDGNQIAFFHESFFDYAFARQWANRNQTLVEFLAAGQQELFRRAQVRQILHHLRERDTSRYLDELASTLGSGGVRFHLKEAILAVLAGLADPTPAELQVFLDTMAAIDLGRRAWQVVCSPQWSELLTANGQIRQWLESGTPDEQGLAVDALAVLAKTQPDRAASVVSGFQHRAEYDDWLLWIARGTQLWTSREFFDLLLAAVRAGTAHDRAEGIWFAAHDLVEHEPRWAIELLSAYFVGSSDAVVLAESGKVEVLARRDHSLASLIQKAAAAAPAAFVTTLLPFMVRVMAVAVVDSSGPGFPRDRHFTHCHQMSETDEVDNALLAGMRSAIAAVVRQDPAAAKPMLEGLAANKSSGAQSLLYRGLGSVGSHYAGWSAELLLEGVDRLFCGELSNSVWGARELMRTIAGYLDDSTHQALESAVRDLRFDWEGRRWGYHAFTLLSALDPNRLTPIGRRRLGEYQRKFGAESPPEPAGIVSGVIRPPIAGAAIAHMTDDDWLRAMGKHDADRTDWDAFTGGAPELANVLQERTKDDPLRFARLALRLDARVHASYPCAILIGLSQAFPVPSEHEEVFAAVRHLAGLGLAETDRWLGPALRPYLKTTPLDLVELLSRRATEAQDPASERTGSSGESEPGEGLRFAGMNSARGSLAEALGDLLVFDVDGTRTTAVLPALDVLATDPIVSVRSQVAHAISAALRFARPRAVAAFRKLISTNDRLLASDYVRQLLIYLGNGGDLDLVLPVIQRMIVSEDEAVRCRGGEAALVAAVNWHVADSLDQVLAGTDAASRAGVAAAAADVLLSSQDTELTATTLRQLFDDPDPDVRKAAVRVVPRLRGEPLRSHEALLSSLVRSSAYEQAIPQLFITLEHAPDQMSALALQCARRFVETVGTAAGDLRTSAAGDADDVCRLVIRGLAQTRTAAERAAFLDLVDELMYLGAYGIDEAVLNAER
ncbi:hypothetical protein [Amycolatopsis sp. GA6-003]|uniref:hypothetical protein n=1 Tax=Amycolatopsis sp. GA6-003 TaxID=2652444 RepID=UPI003916F966